MPADLVQALTAAVGIGHIETDATTMARLARTTLPQGTTALVRVRPADRAQVQAVVRACAAHGAHLHPFSRGCNWGYGDRCAARPGAVLLDLGRMDRIVAVDREHGTATIEPGVTQGALADRLERDDQPWWMDCTGAGPGASLIGNLCERGFGHSAYGDRAAHAAALEVVLADGSVVETGLAAYGGRAGGLFRWGLGPWIDGLFTQGDYGIVTRATLWLVPQPEHHALVLVTIDPGNGSGGDGEDDRRIGAVVAAIARLRRAGVLRSTVHLFNQGRLLGAAERYPYAQADGTAALEIAHPALHGALVARHGLPAWAASGLVGGTRALVRAQIAAVRGELRGIPGVRVITLSPGSLAWADRVARIVPSLRPKLAKAHLAYDLLRGRPRRDTLVGGHWRARGDPGDDFDPLDSGSGMIWVSPVAPADAASVAELLALGRGVVHAHGFEYQTTLSLVSERAVTAITSICFDATSDEERGRARTCHDALIDACAERGFIPYRGSAMTVERLRPWAPAYWDLCQHIRNSLDPAGIISPGRWNHARR